MSEHTLQCSSYALTITPTSGPLFEKTIDAVSPDQRALGRVGLLHRDSLRSAAATSDLASHALPSCVLTGQEQPALPKVSFRANNAQVRFPTLKASVAAFDYRTKWRST